MGLSNSKKGFFISKKYTNEEVLLYLQTFSIQDNLNFKTSVKISSVDISYETESITIGLFFYKNNGSLDKRSIVVPIEYISEGGKSSINRYKLYPIASFICDLICEKYNCHLDENQIRIKLTNLNYN